MDLFYCSPVCKLGVRFSGGRVSVEATQFRQNHPGRLHFFLVTTRAPMLLGGQQLMRAKRRRSRAGQELSPYLPVVCLAVSSTTGLELGLTTQ